MFSNIYDVDKFMSSVLSEEVARQQSGSAAVAASAPFSGSSYFGYHPQQHQKEVSAAEALRATGKALLKAVSTSTTSAGSAVVACDVFPRTQPLESFYPSPTTTTTTSSSSHPHHPHPQHYRLVRVIGMVQDLSDSPMLLQSSVESFFGDIAGVNTSSIPSSSLNNNINNNTNATIIPSSTSNNNTDNNNSTNPSSNQNNNSPIDGRRQRLFTRLIEAHQAYIVPIPGSTYDFTVDGGATRDTVDAAAANKGNPSTKKRAERDDDDDGNDASNGDRIDGRGTAADGNAPTSASAAHRVRTDAGGSSSSSSPTVAAAAGTAASFSSSSAAAAEQRNPLFISGLSAAPDHTADGGGGLLNLPTAPVDNATLALGCVATYLSPSIIVADQQTPILASTDDATAADSSSFSTAAAPLSEGVSLRVNQLVECYGILLAPPAERKGAAQNDNTNGADHDDAAAEDDDGYHHQYGGDCGGLEGFDEDFRGLGLGDEDEDEEGGATFRYERLPYHVAPRLMCVAIRPINHPLELISHHTNTNTDTKKVVAAATSVTATADGAAGAVLSNTASAIDTNDDAVVVDYSPEWFAATRAEFLSYLSERVTAGDSLLAEYLLLHLVSTVDFWHGGVHVPVGDVPIRVLVPEVEAMTKRGLEAIAVGGSSSSSSSSLADNVSAASPCEESALLFARGLNKTLQPMVTFGASLLNLTKGLVSWQQQQQEREEKGSDTKKSKKSTVQALQRGFGANYLTATPDPTAPTTEEIAAAIAANAGDDDEVLVVGADADDDADDDDNPAPSPAAAPANSLFESASIAPNASGLDISTAAPIPNPNNINTTATSIIRSLMPFKDNRENAIVAAPLQVPSHHHMTVVVGANSESKLGTDANNGGNQQQPSAIVASANSTAEDDLLTVIHKQHTFVDYVICKVEQQCDVRCLVVSPMLMRPTISATATTSTNANAAITPYHHHDDMCTIAPLRLACTVVWEPRCVRMVKQLVKAVANTNPNTDANVTAHNTNNALLSDEDDVTAMSASRGDSMGSAGGGAAYHGGVHNNSSLQVATEPLPSTEAVESALQALVALLNNNNNNNTKNNNSMSCNDSSSSSSSVAKFRRYLDAARRRVGNSDDEAWLQRQLSGYYACIAARRSSAAATAAAAAEERDAALLQQQKRDYLLKAASQQTDANGEDDEMLEIGGEEEEAEGEPSSTHSTATATATNTATADDAKRRREAAQAEEALLAELIEWQQSAPELFNNDSLLHNNTLSIVMSLCRAHARSYGRLPRSIGDHQQQQNIDGSSASSPSTKSSGSSGGVASSFLHEMLRDFYHVQRLERARYLRGAQYGYHPKAGGGGNSSGGGPQ